MLTDILETLGIDGSKPRMTRLGCLKIGGLGESRPTRSGGSFRLPRKDDHFTVTTLYRNDAGDLLPDTELMESLADEFADEDGKLRRLPIYVLSNDLDDILQASYCWYSGKSCNARSDGKTLIRFVDKKTGERLPKPQESEWKPEYLNLTDQRGNKMFKLHAIFSCVIGAKLSKWGGVYQFRTTSKISFEQLYSSLVHLSRLTGGILEGLPLQLCVRPVRVSPEGKTTTVYVCHVELRGSDLIAIQQQAMERAKFQLTFHQEMSKTLTAYRKMLPAPGEEGADEQALVASEFHPEAVPPDATPKNYDILDGEEAAKTDAATATTDSAVVTVDPSPVEAVPEEPKVEEVIDVPDVAPLPVAKTEPDFADWPAFYAAIESKLGADATAKLIKMALVKFRKVGKPTETSIDQRKAIWSEATR